MDLTKVNESYDQLIKHFKSIILSTVDKEGNPNASYTPFVIDEDKHIYIYISRLAKHYGNLEATNKVSVLFIKSEAECNHIFARERLTYDCVAQKIAKGSDTHKKAIAQFDEKFGEDVAMLHQMDDFDIFEITPQKGLLVLGFAQAYAINGDDLSQVTHLQGSGGKGHSFKKTK